MPKINRKVKHHQHLTDLVPSKHMWGSKRKKGRLVIRNLSFKITEEQLRQHFTPFGEIRDVNLLKRPDGKMVGCGFVEFVSKKNASQAIAATSGKPLLNRPIIVDWAVPKDIFKQKKSYLKTDEINIKEESISSDEDDKYSSVNTRKVDTTLKQETIKKSDTSSNDSYNSEESESFSNDNVDSDGTDLKQDEKKTRRTLLSCDIDEGRTVFLKNVPFTASKEELRQCVLKFGPVLYAVICIDPLTEHSRGSAFIKFQNKESAIECLKSTNQIKLGSNVLTAHMAIEKQQLQNKHIDQSEKKKEGRNLYLIKEGVIQAGGAAAKGVSSADMSKRLQLEKWKTQILRNLNMVVSRTRLVIHNLPPTVTNEVLRKIIIKYAPERAKITEARVMRDLRQVDMRNKGISKEFGFVTFTLHHDALATLRAINNNPNIFTPQKRPIVGFSIENKAILNAKQRRLEMSRFKNPYFQKDSEHSVLDKDQSQSKMSQHDRNAYRQSEDLASFAGIEAHSGQTIKLPSNRTLKSQAELHRRNLQKERKQLKLQQKIEKGKDIRMKRNQEPKLEKSKKRTSKEEKDNETFNRLVSKYKEQLETTIDLKKWYE